LFQQRLQKHQSTIQRFVFALFMVGTFVALASFMEAITNYFNTKENLDTLNNVIIAIGAALISGTIVIFSFLVFVMQINIERMPYGLFHKFSSDKKLLSSFFLAFVFAILITCTALNKNSSFVSLQLWLVCWLIFFIQFLLLKGYKRAITLVNPKEQMDLLIEDAKREAQLWERRANRWTRHMQTLTPQQQPPSQDVLSSTHEMQRVVFLKKINQNWAAELERKINHAISFARIYTERRDYEVVRTAHKAVIKINSFFIKTRGKTFFLNNSFLPNPLSDEPFITNTLEHFRRDLRVSLSRKDEQHTTQNFDAFKYLTLLYLNIDYSTRYPKKTHAFLAAGYLTGAVEDTLPHAMPDVVMHGLRCVGECAQHFVRHGLSNDINPLIETIQKISGAGIILKDQYPITIIGVEQLSLITLELLHPHDGHDIEFALERTLSAIFLIAQIRLTTPDKTHSNIETFTIETSTLKAYFSNGIFLPRLTQIADLIRNTPSDNKHAQRCFQNIASYGEKLPNHIQPLLLIAIEKKSPFILDLISWMTDLAKVFLFLSTAPACDTYTCEKLQDNTRHLIRCILNMPKNMEALSFTESSYVTEKLFEVAWQAQQYLDENFYLFKALLDWTTQLAQHTTEISTFEHGLLALAILTAQSNEQERSHYTEVVEEKLKELIKKIEKSQPEKLQEVSQSLQRRANNNRRDRHSFSAIENTIHAVDQNIFSEQLITIVTILRSNPSTI
jgi:hypothetical protein